MLQHWTAIFIHTSNFHSYENVVHLANIEKWWPHAYGKQWLYWSGTFYAFFTHTLLYALSFQHWWTTKHGVKSVALVFHNIHINNLPATINTLSESILFSDDASVIIYSTNFDEFCTTSNIILSHMSKRFTVNKLTLNLGKIYVIKFMTIHHNLL